MMVYIYTITDERTSGYTYYERGKQQPLYDKDFKIINKNDKQRKCLCFFFHGTKKNEDAQVYYLLTIFLYFVRLSCCTSRYIIVYASLYTYMYAIVIVVRKYIYIYFEFFSRF